MCDPRAARGPEGLVAPLRMNIPTVVAEVDCTCISLESQAASSSKARAACDSTEESDEDDDSQEDDEDDGLKESAHLDMQGFDCPSTANKKHVQKVSFLKVALVQGADIQIQVAGLAVRLTTLEDSITSIKIPSSGEPLQQGERARAAQANPASLLAEWYNRSANAMFYMPLYQVKAAVSSSTKTVLVVRSYLSAPGPR